ncbi:MAG: ATP-binding protein, partial [Bilophila sp.]
DHGPVSQMELALRDANGEIHTTLATFDAAEYQGKQGRIGWVMDITELKRIEKELVQARNLAEAATKAKSAFLANMSHEIRTPMNAIIGMGHLIRRTGMTPDQQNYIEKLDISANMLLGIINDILDFSKIEAGKMDIEHIPFKLRTALQNIVGLHGSIAQGKGLHLTVSAAEEVPDLLIGDAMRLQQILSNLVSNAIKFTATGVVEVTVQSLPLTGNETAPAVSVTPQQNVLEQTAERATSAEHPIRLLFCVHDSGIGMTPEQCHNLFQPFVQADSSTTRRYGGTGLGLTICSRLVNLMGGTIGLDGTLGEGSTFTFTAVFELDESNKACQRTSDAMPTFAEMRESAVCESACPCQQDAETICILVADDNEINRMVAEGILGMYGMCVETVQSGIEAVEKGCSGAFDLILMDIQMPGMDGIEATKKLRACPGCQDLPIIAMTAHAMSGDRERSLEAGMNDHVTKPIDPDLLYATVMRWLRRDQADKDSVPTKA